MLLIIMNDGQLQTVEQVRGFSEGSEAVEFRGLTAQEKYCWIEEALIRFKYHRLKRGEKGVIPHVGKLAGYLLKLQLVDFNCLLFGNIGAFDPLYY